VVKLPEDPRPVPAGMSARLVISKWFVRGSTSLIASRMMGCWISSGAETLSMREYFSRMPSANISWIVT
jgi:hypothetical protein